MALTYRKDVLGQIHKNSSNCLPISSSAAGDPLEYAHNNAKYCTDKL